MPQIETNLDPQREAEIMDRVGAYYDAAVSGNSNLMERMEKAQRYTFADQWDPTVKDSNTRRKKFSLTIPLIRPQINQIAGYYIQNPKDPSIRSYRGGSRLLAEVLTALVMHATKDESAQFELVQAVFECTMTGRSYMGAFLDYETDPLSGSLEIRHCSCFDVLTDPATKEYDINSRRDGAKFIIWRPWVDKEWIARKWPDKAETLGLGDSAGRGATGGGLWGWMSRHANRLVYEATGKRMSSVGTSFGMTSEDMEYAKYKERLDHTWWLEYRSVYYGYSLMGDGAEPLVIVTDEEKQEAEQAAETHPEAFRIMEAVAPVMNHTISVGNTLLENRFDEYNLIQSGQTIFPIVPFNCFFNNGYTSGIAEDLIGSQDWVNLMRSTVANIIKKMPNHGYYINKDVDKTFAKWLEENGGIDGVVIDVSRGGGMVQPIQPVQLPVAAVQMTEIGKAEIKEVSAVRIESPESAGKEGWQTIGLKQQAAMTGASPVLNNIDYSLHIYYNLIATIIRGTPVYSDREIGQIIDEKDLIDQELLEQMRFVVAASMGIQYPIPPTQFSQVVLTKLGPEDNELVLSQLKAADQLKEQLIQQIDQVARPMARQLLIRAMRNPRSGRYQTTISTSPSSPTLRLLQFGQITDVAKLLGDLGYQGAIGPAQIIEASDLPNKEKILADIEQRQAQLATVAQKAGAA